MPCRPTPCWIPLRNLDLTPASVAPEGMRRKPGPRKEYFLYAMNSVSGIQKDKDQNSGISITVRFRKGRMFGFFLLVTGRNWISVIISVVKKLISPRFIFLMKGM